MTRYGEHQPLMGPIAQFIMNCIISAVVAGMVWGIGNSAFDLNWDGRVYGGLFLLCLLACYGIWVLFIRDNSGSNGGSSSGGDGGFLSGLLD